MELCRNREWRIYQKHFWIKKRLIRHHQTSLSRYPIKDASSIERDLHCWYFLLGTYAYFRFKTNKWGGRYESKPRYGKKKRLHCVDNWYYGGTSTRISDKREFKKILRYYGIK